MNIYKNIPNCEHCGVNGGSLVLMFDNAPDMSVCPPCAQEMRRVGDILKAAAE